MNDAEKQIGLSFESADVYARSLGIKIEDYELVPIMIHYNHDKDNVGKLFEVIPDMGKILAHDCKGKNVNYVLVEGLKIFATQETLEYVCSIRFFCADNVTPNGVTRDRDYWINCVTATGLRKKVKTKTAPPPMITFPTA